MDGESKRNYPSFKSFFRSELLPILTRFELKRNLRVPLLVLAGALVLLSGMFFLWGGDSSHSHLLDAILVISCLLLPAIPVIFRLPLLWDWVYCRRPSGMAPDAGGRGGKSRSVARRLPQFDFSRNVVARVAAFAMPGLSHHIGDGIRQGDFMDSRLTDNFFNRYESRDLFLGRRGQAWLAFSWLKVTCVQKNREDESQSRPLFLGWPKLLFRGWFFKALFPRRFQGETYVHHDVAEASMGWLGRSIQGLAVPEGLELIHLEDSEFERYFMVHSGRQLDARYILSPSFMRAVVTVRKRLRHPLALAFRYDCMYAAFPSPAEYFTCLPIHSFTDPAFTRHLYHAIRGFGDLVDDVNRNHRLWFDVVRE